MIENKIKFYRNKAELTQYQLAKMVGMTRRGILQIEKKQQDIKVSHALKLAQVLGVSVEDLFIYQ
ncbi:MAG: helix-turn-helix domain-containing protein [Peptoniphilaceae bacterium]|nr:helix-turn-helix domain-containing protein [Peptoniphilaceae bacterium]MDD7433738.1 helix-turn-helix domain-containing protein [Peptoniphilaceae bacterium]MDY3075574.1 helix-turn-helix domain-containing protein [Peptoniphilaceae bacterium]MDY6146823.1 helix-turn-helix domain-containing protein [Peptoniphilaceae bacterium]